MQSWHALRTVVHDLDLEEQDWIESLHTQARELLDDGLGTFTYSYRFNRDMTIRLGAVAGYETAPEFWRALSSWGSNNARALTRIYGTGPGSLSAAMRAATHNSVVFSNPHSLFEPHGVADVFTVVGHEASGFGIFLTAPRARTLSSLTPIQRRAFERLAVELVAAVRLREHLGKTHRKRLSASEMQVARLLMDGCSDKFIAAQLNVTLSTVSTFTRRVREKLGCRSGEEALLLRPRMRSSNLHRRLAFFDRLTNAECDVASELLVGSSYGDIAERRGVSVRTVASQCAAVFRKCNVSGRRELAATLLRE